MQTDTNKTTTTNASIPGLLLQLNFALASYNDFPQNLNRALKTIGELSHHDRIHIIEIHSNMTFSVKYAWNNKQIKPVPEKWKKTKIVYDPSLEEQLCSQNYVAIYDNLLNPDSDLYAVLKAQECRQMLALPLFESSSQFAFIIFMKSKDAPKWQQEEIRILTDLASIIAIHLNHHHLINQLFRQIKKHRQSQNPTETLHHRLTQWHAELMPTWEKIRNTQPEIRQSIPALSDLDRHIGNLNKICRNPAVK